MGQGEPQRGRPWNRHKQAAIVLLPLPEGLAQAASPMARCWGTGGLHTSYPEPGGLSTPHCILGSQLGQREKEQGHLPRTVGVSRGPATTQLEEAFQCRGPPDPDETHRLVTMCSTQHKRGPS